MLEEAEVHTDRVVVIDVSEVAARGELAHLADRAGVHERVVDGEDAVPALRLVNQADRLVDIQRHRFFDQHVLAGAQRLHPEVEVCRDGRGDCHRVDPRVPQKVAIVRRRLDRRIARLDPLELPRSQVADGDHSFKVPKRAGVAQKDIHNAVLDHVAAWLRKTALVRTAR